jgi:hypothetical protein
MRFILFGIILMVGILASAQAAAREELKLRVITPDASIRLEPRPDSSIVSKVKLGAVLISGSKTGEWFRVDLPPGEDGYVISGFVHQDHVEAVGEAGAVSFDTPKRIRIGAETAEIREAAAAGSREMGQAPRGTELDAFAMAGEWYKVEVAPGVFGYIHRSHVEAEEKPAPQEPPAAAAEPAPQERPRDPPPSAPQPVDARKRKFSLKLTLGFGFGFDKIETGYYKVQGDNMERIDVYPGGGGHFGLDLGYYLTREVRLEVGIGYQNSGVFASNQDEVSFTRMPLTLTVLYEIPSPKKFQVYVGGGAGLYNSPELEAKAGGTTESVKYGSSFGLHGLVGAVTRSKSGKWFYFGELRYVGVFNYQWTEAKSNGYPAIPHSKYREFGGNGIFVLFGIGTYF